MTVAEGAFGDGGGKRRWHCSATLGRGAASLRQAGIFCFKMEVLLLFRSSEANRWGEMTAIKRQLS